MSSHLDDAAVPSLGDLLEEAAVLAELDPRAATNAELRDAVLVHAELLGRLEAQTVAWVGAFHRAGVACVDGAHSTATWLAVRTELDRAHAGALVARADELRECAAVAAAYADGRLGTAKVRALLDARRAHPERFAEHEVGLVDRLVPLSVAHARIAAAHWRTIAEATKAFEDAERERQRAAAAGAGPDDDAADDGVGDDDPSDVGSGDSGDPGDGGAGGQPEPEPVPDPDPDPADANGLRLSQTFQGRWVLEGQLDPISGAELHDAIEAYIDQQFRQGTWSKDDGHTAAYRRAHALLELVCRGALASSRHGDPRPSVVVRIDPATLAGIPAESLAAGLERDCSLDDGTPVDARGIERLLCTARIQALWTRMRTDGTVETLGVTDLLRDATRAQRRALKQRDGRCVFPGCGAAADWCEAHHLVPHEDLGPTLLQNLVLLCRYHHHLVHEGGWTLWRDPATGTLHLVDPQHKPRPLPPPGHKQPALDPDRLEPHRPPPAPPHLHPPRFRTASDPPRPTRSGPEPGAPPAGAPDGPGAAAA